MMRSLKDAQQSVLGRTPLRYQFEVIPHAVGEPRRPSRPHTAAGQRAPPVSHPRTARARGLQCITPPRPAPCRPPLPHATPTAAPAPFGPLYPVLRGHT
jgi:hypothetical protein